MTPPAKKAFCHIGFVIARRRELTGGDAEGIDTHAVLLEDPISEKGDSRVTPSDLDTGHTE